ncbi:MAG: thioredoxin family protein [Thermoguttaceae bacterium]
MDNAEKNIADESAEQSAENQCRCNSKGGGCPICSGSSAAIPIILILCAVGLLAYGVFFPNNYISDNTLQYAENMEKKGEHGESDSSTHFVLSLTEDNFDETIRSGVVLVDFWMQHCAPCETMVPRLERIAEQMQGRAVIAKINGPQNRSISGRFGITAYPTMILFKNGEQIDLFLGAQPEEVILKAVQSAVEKQPASAQSTSSKEE